MEIVRMPYGNYKKHYADCEIVYGSYNEWGHSIEVKIPEGRMKPSGTRGKKFIHRFFDGVDSDGRKVRVCIKAISPANAEKQLRRNYPDCTFDLN